MAVNGIYASIIPSYKYNLVLKSFSYGTQVMGHPVHGSMFLFLLIFVHVGMNISGANRTHLTLTFI
jgi:hypothetical protein